MKSMNENSELEIEGYKIVLSEEVYPPSEDTYFLLDSIDYLSIRKTDIVVEPCTGSGIISIKISNTGARIIASDINFLVCKIARDNIKKNTRRFYNIDVVCGNLLDFIKEKSVEYVICNPPYLPEQEESLDRNKWWNGGKDGTEVIKKLIVSGKKVLKDSGRLVFLASSLSDVNKIERTLFQNSFKIVKKLSKEIGDETIFLFDCTK